MARLFGKQDNLTVTDKLRLGNGAKLKVVNTDGSETEVTLAELKALAGLTATTAELNILDGVTSTTAELNKLGGSGATVASGTTQTKIADASTAHALNATFSDTEVEAALDALGTKINTVIDALEAFKVSAAV